MKWLNYLANLFKSKTKAVCPFCGADEVHYEICILLEERADGYMDIWCDACHERDSQSIRSFDDSIPRVA
ncbi:MAG: hypothetical protein GX939_03985 [Clostridiaceae bacterium]|jgi:hypothetical protein|nr:hypothetical protein [Clostridiaceae bacterium]